MKFKVVLSGYDRTNHRFDKNNEVVNMLDIKESDIHGWASESVVSDYLYDKGFEYEWTTFTNPHVSFERDIIGKVPLEVVKYLREQYSFDIKMFKVAGIPDFVVWKKELERITECFFMEAKMKNNPITWEQKKWLEDNTNIICYVARVYPIPIISNSIGMSIGKKLYLPYGMNTKIYMPKGENL